MGFWNGFGSISSVLSALNPSSGRSKPEDDPTYKQYAEDIRNFELDPKLAKEPVSPQAQPSRLNNMQDKLADIDSIDDVKKHFQDKE